ncbi:MAG: MMPL family transporter [Deltaproteobacteria bacterium]|nr:MMPL family transporter [Deltaproteobacteria bacterium]
MIAAPVPTAERSRRFVAWLLRHGRLLWLLAGLAAVPATLRTVGLYANLHSEMEELLPPNAESVRAVEELRRRMPGLQFLGVLADVGPHPAPARLAAAERFIDDLAARVRAYPPALVGGVRTGFAAERAFIERHAALLLERDDLHSICERIQDRLRWEFGQRAGTLIDDSEPPPPLDFSDIERRYRQDTKWANLAGNRFTDPRLGLSLLLVEAGGFSTSARQAKEMLERVASDVAALGGPAAYAPGMRVGYTGDVAISAEETSALVQDLTLSSLLVVAAVGLVLLLFFRWPPCVLALLLPLALATVCAFALASLLGVDVLNSNTAFLGSIIVGNGINFGIVQIARYMEERRAGQDVREALARSLWGTRPGTLSAALAAAVAYASLTAMQFRGFRQFGVIGGIGMVLAWTSTFLLTPPLLAWMDRKGRPSIPAPFRFLERLHPMDGLARLVARFPRVIVLVGIAFTLAALLQVRGFSSAQIEYDLSRMRRADTWRSGEGYWGRKMDAMLGQYLTPVVLLTDGPVETRAVAQALREAAKSPPLDAMVARVRTLDDFLPPDQAERLREIERTRKKLTANVRADLTDEQRRGLEALFPAEPIGPVELGAIPETLLKGMKERNGRADSAVLVYPKLGAGLWDGPRNTAFVATLRAIARVPEQSGGNAARVAGAPPLSADVIASMSHDGPLASLLAFVGVVLTVLVLFRGRMATPFVLASLLMGVLWMLALCMALRIKINFVNFIAFPITFGIGIDYAVNVMARFVGDGGRDVGGAIRGTGGAVSLCSATTVIGYSSLLVAKNLGLFYFGFLAVLGELTCLSVAVVVLPAALLWWRRGENGIQEEPTESPKS